MEHLTWEEIVEKYPDRWVALTNCNMLYGGIQDADIVAVLMNDEVDDFRLFFLMTLNIQRRIRIHPDILPHTDITADQAIRLSRLNEEG